MRRGILKAGLFYGSGFILTAVFYVVFGAAAGHGPGLWFVIAFLTLLVGIFSMLSASRSYFFKGKSQEQLGLIVSHTTVVAFAIATTIIWLRMSDPRRVERSDGNEEPAGTTFEVLNRNDTSWVLEDGNVRYMKVGDSVHINEIGLGLK